VIAARAAAAVALGLASGCAPALRTPPDLADVVGGTSDARPEVVDRLLDEAGAAWDERTEASVRRAERLSLDAAASPHGRVRGLVGATRARVWLAERAPDPERRREIAAGAVAAAQGSRWGARSSSARR